jgi:hypothetical protein
LEKLEALVDKEEKMKHVVEVTDQTSKKKISWEELDALVDKELAEEEEEEKVKPKTKKELAEGLLRHPEYKKYYFGPDFKVYTIKKNEKGVYEKKEANVTKNTDGSSRLNIPLSSGKDRTRPSLKHFAFEVYIQKSLKGRPRITFKDGNKTNYAKENLECAKYETTDKKKKSKK